MVRVVKRFKTSDCDSDMRGFESHHAPQYHGYIHYETLLRHAIQSRQCWQQW